MDSLTAKPNVPLPEIDLSGFVPDLGDPEDSVVFNNDPTLADVEQAEADYKIVVVICPTESLEGRTVGDHVDELQARCGGSKHLAFYVTPNGMTEEQAREYILNSMRVENRDKGYYALGQTDGGKAYVNIIFRSVLEAWENEHEYTL